MKTILVEIKTRKAFAILKELENLDVLKIIKNNISVKKTNLSEKYRGVFTTKDAQSFNKHTQIMRKEWENT